MRWMRAALLSCALSSACERADCQVGPVQVDAEIGASATVDAGPGGLDRSCAELARREPGSEDGLYTLYLDGDAARPYMVYCDGMASAQPREYLGVSPETNYAAFATVDTGGARKLVRVEYKRVRLDVARRAVDLDDTRFTEPPVPAIVGRAHVDLSGTGFELVSGTAELGLATVRYAARR